MELMGNNIFFMRIQYPTDKLKLHYNQFIDVFLTSFFFKSVNILGSIAFHSLEDFKKKCYSFLNPILLVVSANYLLLFLKLKEFLLEMCVNTSEH